MALGGAGVLEMQPQASLPLFPGHTGLHDTAVRSLPPLG